jgi:3-phenylpropionate/trans-cinnamate dioxygenase ferredoxin reductase subunit
MSVSRQALVIGASAAGLAAADGLRDGGWDGAVSVLGAEMHTPYDRPMLSKSVLSSGTALNPSALRTDEQLATQAIDLLLGHRAMGLDVDRQLVVTNNGEAISYDVLVVATGSNARRLLTTSGDPLPALRDLDDLTRIRELTASGSPVAVVGAGFIGLEVASSLRARGLSVELFGRGRVPMESHVGNGVGHWLRAMHADHGVTSRLDVEVVAIHGHLGDYRIELSDGSVRPAQVVLAGIGVDPADEWLRGSGVARQGGVMSDPTGRTSVPGVWVAGEVASIEDPRTGRRRRFEHWVNAVQQGRQVGLNAAQEGSAPLPQLRSFWTEQYGHFVRVLGQRDPGDADVVTGGEIASGAFVVAHEHEGAVHGVTSCGYDQLQRTFRRLLHNNADLAQFRAASTEHQTRS